MQAVRMMPRLRLRRLVLSVIALGGLTLVAINFRFREASIFVNDLDAGSELPRRRPQHHPTADETTPSVERYWFMQGGSKRPTAAESGSAAKLWPHQNPGDRIVEQLMYVPPGYNPDGGPIKKILLYFGRGGWNDLPMGRTVFLKDNCPVNRCELTTAVGEAESADAVFFKDRFTWPKHRRPLGQVWLLFLLECPLHTQGFTGLTDVFNWTATYRHDSDIVAPYEKFVTYEEGSSAWQPRKGVARRNNAQNKTNRVAWFVSNCAARNKRFQYARELSKHISVDIYGSCGSKRCPRSQADRCFSMLDRDYKFYLAFENSNCKDYITEKFFVNGLSRNILPVVMGARPEDYVRSSPRHSFIHVEDFPSPKELAEYLIVLDRNDTLYNEYFAWKETGQFINTYFWCRVCAMLHAPPMTKVYRDMHTWWAGGGTCVTDQWRPTK